MSPTLLCRRRYSIRLVDQESCPGHLVGGHPDKGNTPAQSQTMLPDHQDPRRVFEGWVPSELAFTHHECGITGAPSIGVCNRL